MKKRVREVVRVRVPERQASIFHVPGDHGGWFISLLYGLGTEVDVSMAKLRKLLEGSRGTVIIARRLVGAELRLFESYRSDVDAETHARLVYNERMRLRRSR